MKEVVRGWYIPSSPEEEKGDSTSRYANYWEFCSRYITDKYGDEYTVSADHSVQLHSGNQTVPAQLVVRAPDASNFKTDLPYNTSLFHIRGELPQADLRIKMNGLMLFSLPAALVFSTQSLFTQNPTDARTALAMIGESSEVLSILLNGGHSTIAGRLAGAFRNIGRDRIANDILKTMKAADYDVRESDPFATKVDVALSFRERSPYANRIRLIWNSMRESVISTFPKAPGIPKEKADYLKAVEEVYLTDAYHSLSIERYRVTPELIAAGILKAGDLAGYRTSQVYIGGSKHVPLDVSALRDAMPLLFELLTNEPEASVRAVLGHFVFVNIHPYMDGNGRMGRFLMNVMLSSGGYPWTVIPVELRTDYMSCLAAASVKGDIVPFVNFIAELVNLGLKGTPVANLNNAG